MKTKGSLILHVLVGVGAIAGGMAVVIDPTGSNMGVPLELLKYSPFQDFLIPGLFLVAVLGIGNLAVAWIGYKYPMLIPYGDIAMGGILVVWIVVQCIMLRSIAILHLIFFAIGCIQIVLGYRRGKKQNAPYFDYLP
ncbi:hypothetical protein G7062_09360 [Erysipelothrix sp. HDW6C]|uniref:hypothetical protein n=1 Tax=Erysipelothrix sp. HDW6C TaxID=2714930 RepID=UPI00140C1B2D|nr:hypothetical protein [Erysipelothrix sp. HDW6C]QIK70497.1 hypothetical protein G7062_09360 [Erysipelothrix sp. HDW6C]